MHVVPEWLELICLAFCIGVIACRLWFFPHAIQNKFSYQDNFVSRMWTFFCYGLAVIIGGSVAELLTRTAEMSGQPFPAFFNVLPTVLFRTHYGGVWLIRVAALALLALSKTAVRYRDKPAFLFPMLLLALIVSMTASASGHASDAGDFSLPEIMDWLHLLGASVWGGGLVVLSMFVLRDFTGGKNPTPPLIAIVASRFSSMAGLAVAAVAATALYNAWVYVGSLNALLRTPYGWTVLIKIFLFFIVVNLGAFNRYVSVPLFQEQAGLSAESRGIFTRIILRLLPRLQPGVGSGEQILTRFMHSVRVEAALIAAILLCAALLRHEIPARHLSHLGHTGAGHPIQHHAPGDM